uniref:Peptidase S26 domain-containing protein n=1 Tax=Panagrellus redivivus TaxID=6233 RepID=A0A7E4ZZ21_PANRE
MPETVSWARTFTQKVVLRFLYIYSGCNVVSTYLGGVVFLSGDSMQPTIQGGDVVATRTFRPRVHKVEKGQIVCVKSPTDPGLLVCKRVAALEHERVGNVVIEGHSVNPRVAKGHVFLLGDNLDSSTDSRQYGPVPMGLIHSKVVFRVWPPHRIGWLNDSA